MRAVIEEIFRPEDWPARRKELVELFRREEYGRIPDGWTAAHELEQQTRHPGAVCRRYRITVTYGGRTMSFPFALWLPDGVQEPVPVTVLISNHGRTAAQAPAMDPEQMEKLVPMLQNMLGSPERLEAVGRDMLAPGGKKTLDIETDLDDGYWPVRKLLERGWGAAAFYASDLAPDNAEHWCTEGAGRLFVPADRPEDGCGCLSLWAFGASRVLDVLRTVPQVDPARISVAGHSRGGKTALWAAVQDERFETAFANNAGCCGTALNEGKYGENVTSILMMMGYWFCPGFRKYSGVPAAEMPFDQHMLIAAMAPRPVYVASGSTDYWEDPEAEFAGCAGASPVWEALGLPGLVCPSYPEPETVWHDGCVGYHLREGGHKLTEQDWMRFCDFEERRHKEQHKGE